VTVRGAVSIGRRLMEPLGRAGRWRCHPGQEWQHLAVVQ